MPNYHKGNLLLNATRFPGGINNCYPTDNLANLRQPDRTLFHDWFQEFDTFNAADFTTTLVGTGTTVATAGQGGVLTVTNTAAAPDSVALQAVRATFLPVFNRRTFFKIKLNLPNVLLPVLQVGLILPDATPLDAVDGIYIQKAAGTNILQAFVRKDATTGSVTQANIGTIDPNVDLILGFEFDGKGEVNFYINDNRVADLPATVATLPDVLLAPSFYIGNSSAVVTVATVDYMYASQER